MARFFALVWFFIAKVTGREIGWIAWGVGVAAGFGMMMGYNGHSVHSGAIAAGMAVVGIVVGKLMVFAFVILPMVTVMLGGRGDAASEKEAVTVFLAFANLEAQGVDPSTATKSQESKAERDAREADRSQRLAGGYQKMVTRCTRRRTRLRCARAVQKNGIDPDEASELQARRLARRWISDWPSDPAGKAVAGGEGSQCRVVDARVWIWGQGAAVGTTMSACSTPVRGDRHRVGVQDRDVWWGSANELTSTPKKTTRSHARIDCGVG